MFKTSRCCFLAVCSFAILISSLFYLVSFTSSSNVILRAIMKPYDSIWPDHQPATILTPKSVLVLIGATGNYFKLALHLIDSAKVHFCKPAKHCSNVTYIVFTDGAIKPSKATPIGNNHYIQVVRQRRLGWPDDSMKRYHMYLSQLPTLQIADFILALDADLKVVADVSLADIYGDLVATLHPGYVLAEKWELPYEWEEPRSKAYVPLEARDRYFTAAVWGGRSCSFIQALRKLVWQLDEDRKELGANFTAIWHDESHLNRYLIENPPTRILTPSYYYPEIDGRYSYEVKSLPKKIIALSKDHKKLRLGLATSNSTNTL